MYDRVLKRFRQAVHERRYVMTTHAEEEMENDDLTILDMESIVLTGSITGSQRDPLRAERKYPIKGRTTGGDTATAVARLSPTGKLVIITVFRERQEEHSDDL